MTIHCEETASTGRPVVLIHGWPPGGAAWKDNLRDDLRAITVPMLVLHSDADATVPFEGSGRRTHAAIPHSELHVVAGGPHGIT